MGIGWYVIGLILSIVFYTQGKEHWRYNQKRIAIFHWLVAAGIFARSVYRLAELL